MEKVGIALILLALSTAMLPGYPAWGGAAPAVPGSPSIAVVIQGGLLTVYAKNATLAEVLLAVGNTVGFNTVIRGELSPERATWTFNDLSLPEVIRRLIGGYNSVIFYDELDLSKVSKLFVYGELDGSPSEPPSSRPDAELQDSADMNLQIEGIEANLGNPDASARMEVVSLLESIESDRIVPLLGQILFGDPDPGVRLAAMEALARQRGEAAKAFLEAATNDRDTAVRETAILALERRRW
jgi:hypothetical protein